MYLKKDCSTEFFGCAKKSINAKMLNPGAHSILKSFYLGYRIL